ncbi:flagellar hook assembly protein FlgD, partial [Proteus mirabilis]
LMTQLQHQDPLNPMDHKEFSAQLAQFSSLEQLTNIGNGIQGLKGEMGSDAKLQALGFIGKKVQAAGGELEFKENVTARILSHGG